MLVHLVLLLFILLISFYKVIYQPIQLFDAAKINAPYDVVIVPGLPYDAGKWNPLLKSRIVWGCHLYQQGHAKNIIFSGSAVYTPYQEGAVMKMYAQQLGLPDSVLYAEVQAEHSTENLWNCTKMAKKLGFKKIALTTDPFQNMFLMSFGKKKGLEVDYIPFVLSKVHYLEKPDFEIDPSSARVENFVSIKDRETFWERLGGTRGDNIDYESK